MTSLNKHLLPNRTDGAHVDPRFALLDLVLVIGFASILNGVTYVFVKNYAGPITALCTLALATFLLYRRGIRWFDFGLSWPEKWRKVIWQPIVVLIGAVAVGVVAGKLGGLFLEPAEVASRTGEMEGNFLLFISWVALGWMVGGFAEEMLMRGFLLNRAETVLKNVRDKTTFAVVFQALIFGLVHFYNRGPLGAWTITAVGLALGTFYIAFGRKLWPLILAHGLVDTLSFLEDYLGA